MGLTSWKKSPNGKILKSDVVIAKNGLPVVKLAKYQIHKPKSSYGILKGKVRMSDNFNDESPEINKMFYGE